MWDSASKHCYQLLLNTLFKTETELLSSCLSAVLDPQRLQKACQSSRQHLAAVSLLPPESQYDNMPLRGGLCTQLSASEISKSAHLILPQHTQHDERMEIQFGMLF